jgi:hypothetical protein
MNKVIWLLVFLALGGAAYYFWKQVPDTPKEATLGGYVNTLHNDEVKAQAVASSTNVISVQQIVNKYKTDKGSFPSSLQDLVPDYLDHVPGGLQYDSTTGMVAAQ